MSYEEYTTALKAGQKEYRSRLQNGEYPYLPILDEILSYTNVEYEVSLGLCEVNIEQIVGTKTKGRTNAFAHNFMPLLGSHTEFAAKWIDLCTSLQEEGMRDPIKVCEFMNRFYVVEGNKRVSVLKYLDAYSVPCNVTRVVPKRTDTKENRLYYEFLDFYAVTGVNYLSFSEEGRYAKLLKRIGTSNDEKWTAEEQIEFRSVYTRFRKAFEAKGGGKLPITVGDAMLAYITVYGYEDSKNKLATDMKADLSKIWDEFLVLTEEQSVELLMEPPKPTKNTYKNLLNLILPDNSAPLKIAFFFEKTPKESSWSYSHELGRMYLENVFPGQVETAAFSNVLPGENDQEMMEAAIKDGYSMIFATAPTMLPASLKIAANYPDVKILNCSLNISHPTIRTYYARMYEAKFLAGAIAGSMSSSGKIGYLANYPIFGMAASINAFALGARMVNANARIYLDWTTLKDRKPEITKDPDIHYIIDQDMITPVSASRHFGLYRVNGANPDNLAMTTWHWGKLYEKIVRIVLNGTWKNVDAGTRAINYWWGMSAGVVDLIYSQDLPHSTKRLVELLKNDICSDTFIPFSGELYDQNGVLMNDKESSLAPEDIITMNWLSDNVEGFIPLLGELTEEAQAVTQFQGLEAVPVPEK